MPTSLPDDISLGPVRLRVADRARSAAWLERVLGLVGLAPPTPAADRALHGNAAGVPLVELRERPGARRVPRRGLLGLYHYAILLPTRADLGSFLLHLIDIGEPFAGSDHLVSEAIYLTDPDGITVEVYADRPRESWTHRGEDFAAAVNPLDGEGLARSAGAARWQGAPEGARMGHLHFNVGDLLAAERFYVSGLGFRVTTRLFAGALFVSAAGYHHHVGLNTWAAGAASSGEADAGLDAWTLVVPSGAERAALFDRLSAGNIHVEHESDGGVVRDPWGITVRVIPG